MKASASLLAAVLAISAALLSAPVPAAAQFPGTFSSTPSGPPIDRIVIEGTQRIDPDTVRTYMVVREGDPYSAARVDQSLKNLFETGLFADVTIRRQGDGLVVQVVENPIINRIAFEGNRRMDDEELEAEIQLRPRVVYTRAKVQEDVQRILELYRRSGRYAVSVDPKVIRLDQNRVDLAFEINEGPSTTVRSIAFVGNREYSDSELREVIETSEEAWYRFLSASDTYDPDRLTYDRELLRRHYLSNGYADFQVKSAIAELSPDKEKFYITFTVEEGERYRFGTIDLATTLEDLDPEVLRGELEVEEGEWYDADDVEDSVQNLTDAVGSLGYAFVDVRPRMDRDREALTIDVTFDIQEGPRVFVERIDIQGNVRTRDEVIRREFSLAEGDAFNAAKLRRSRQRVQDLGFFERVEVTNEPSPTAPDRTVVKVAVEEKSTGEVTFGVGWSSAVGAIVEVGLRERNLLGRGQDLKVSGTWAQRRSQLDLSFTEPYFLGRRLRAGFDLFGVERDYQDESSYNQRTFGGALRLGYNYNQALSHDFKYTAQYNNIFDVDDDASRYIKDQPTRSILSQVGHELVYDKRDSKLNPTEGYLLGLSNDVAGLGGTEYFVRTGLRGAYYLPFGELVDWSDVWVFSLGGRAGYIIGLNDDVNINQRYFMGGDNLRGFASAGASPRDSSTNDALGGNWMVTSTAEMQVPLGLPEELGLTGRVFADAGLIGSPDNFDSATMDGDETLRLSVGTGLTWISPLGPISVDFGFPLLQEDYDEVEVFRLSFGSRF